MLKKFYAVIFAAAFTIALTIFNNPPAFENYAEERTVYVSDSSSSIFEKYPQFSFVNRQKGESCKIPVDNFDLQAFITEFCAEKVMTEKSADTVSYYFVSPKLKNCVTVNGKKINVHIAINDEYAVIGSPIIYGGY